MIEWLVDGDTARNIAILLLAGNVAWTNYTNRRRDDDIDELMVALRLRVTKRRGRP